MKKLTALMLVIIMLFSLSACKEKTAELTDEGSGDKSVTADEIKPVSEEDTAKAMEYINAHIFADEGFEYAVKGKITLESGTFFLCSYNQVMINEVTGEKTTNEVYLFILSEDYEKMYYGEFSEDGTKFIFDADKNVATNINTGMTDEQIAEKNFAEEEEKNRKAAEEAYEKMVKEAEEKAKKEEEGKKNEEGGETDTAEEKPEAPEETE